MSVNTRKILFVFILLLVLTPISMLIWKNLKNQPRPGNISSQDSSNKDSIIVTPNYNKQLSNEIKLTFSSSKYQDIINLTDLASSEKDPDKQYQAYKQVFDKIVKAYQESKDPKFRFALIQLKSYMRALPSYNENELKIPK